MINKRLMASKQSAAVCEIKDRFAGSRLLSLPCLCDREKKVNYDFIKRSELQGRSPEASVVS